MNPNDPSQHDGAGVLCAHCGQLESAHGPASKCLFEATTYKPGDVIIVDVDLAAKLPPHMIAPLFDRAIREVQGQMDRSFIEAMERERLKPPPRRMPLRARLWHDLGRFALRRGWHRLANYCINQFSAGGGVFMDHLSLRDKLLHAVLSRLFEYRDITKVSDKKHLYLRRYFITKKKPGSDERIFVHFIARSDDDRDLHDHPWDFTSYILLGGYTEESFMFEPGDPTIKQYFGKFSKLVRKATWAHRLTLEPGVPTWTLVFRRGRKREWGFWQDGKTWVPWNIYLGVNEEFDEDMEKKIKVNA
jgi:hypothetical protein